MQSSEFHVSLNGVKYRLAEDAEGEHYVRVREPSRPPNAQVVQGDDGGKFNVRPDMLLWSWTDWSQGEGQLKFDPQQPGRSRILEGVNFFGKPGNLILGYYADEVEYNFPGAADTEDRAIVRVADVVYGVDIGAARDDYYVLNFAGDPLYWSAPASGSMGTTNGAANVECVTADNTYFYFRLYGSASIYRVEPTVGVTHLNNQTENPSNGALVAFGDYLYMYADSGKIYEISKTTANLATAETPILDFSASGTTAKFLGSRLVAGDRRLYAGAQIGADTVIYEIVPSSAAGTGYGREIARLNGLVLETMWWHGGLLFWSGVNNEPDGSTTTLQRDIYYYQPDGSWGTIGHVRSQDGVAISQYAPAAGAVSLHTSGFSSTGTYAGRTLAQAAISLFEVDAISGGFGQTGRADSVLAGTEVGASSLVKMKDYFIATKNTGGQIMWDTTRYNTEGGVAISPDFDFAIAATKILHSIEIVTEPLPASTSVTVAYSLDGGSWTSLSAHDVDDSAGTKWTISTGGSTKTFRSMALRLTLSGTSTATPTVKSVNVRASVDTHVNVWQLLLDCTDETSPRGFDGAKLIDNLTALSDGSVFTLIDGYEQRTFSGDTSYNVVIDSMAVILTKAGEGYVQVTLREVF